MYEHLQKTLFSLSAQFKKTIIDVHVCKYIEKTGLGKHIMRVFRR